MRIIRTVWVSCSRPSSDLTSVHEGIEEGGIDEEEQVGEELQRNVSVHLERSEKSQRLLQYFQYTAQSSGHSQLAILGKWVFIQQTRECRVHTLWRQSGVGSHLYRKYIQENTIMRYAGTIKILRVGANMGANILRHLNALFAKEKFQGLLQ